MAPPLSEAASLDLIRVLTEDHDKILHLFSEFERIRGQADDAVKQTLVEIACIELVIHAQVEEEYLYSALRKQAGWQDALDEAQVEHMVGRQLIGELESMVPEDELYDARFKVLGAYMRHHFEEEREKIFPLLRDSRLDLAALTDSLVRRRDELRSEFGLPDGEYAEVEPAGRFEAQPAAAPPTTRPAS